MVTNEERMKILKMLQEGKISAEEAASLIEWIDQGDGTLKGEVVTKNLNGRWFRCSRHRQEERQGEGECTPSAQPRWGGSAPGEEILPRRWRHRY